MCTLVFQDHKPNQGCLVDDRISDPTLFFSLLCQIFPKIELVEGEGEDGSQGRKRSTNQSSPEYLAAVCTFDTFQEMVQEKVQVGFPFDCKDRGRFAGIFLHQYIEEDERLARPLSSEISLSFLSCRHFFLIAVYWYSSCSAHDVYVAGGLVIISENFGGTL